MRATTLNKIKHYGPCADGWQILLAGLGKTEADDEPLSYLTILEINGVADCLWAARADDSPDAATFWRLLACDIAEHFQPADADPRSLNAIRVARAFANGKATAEELSAAWSAAAATADAAARAWAAAAAEAAARDATADAAERKWQTELLRKRLEEEAA